MHMIDIDLMSDVTRGNCNCATQRTIGQLLSCQAVFAERKTRRHRTQMGEDICALH